MSTDYTVIIPFRDRGTDPRRAANLEIVMAWWWMNGFSPQIVSDGLDGDAPFNRHRAYNRAVSGNPDAPGFIFTEADMIVPAYQIRDAVQLAHGYVGLVVPFTQYRYLSDETTAKVRDDYHDQPSQRTAFDWGSGALFDLTPESTMGNGRSIGAINVISRITLDMTGGFTEATHGNWYDDNIIEETFAYLTGPTRWVHGPAVHLYHLPGWKGDHLTETDRRATAHNKQVLRTVRRLINHGNRAALHNLMQYRSPQ